MQITTETNPETGILLAGNTYNSDFGNYVSFFDVDDPAQTFTCDRGEFLGRNGTYKNPEAMGKAKLSGRVGAAQDACAVLQYAMDLTDSEERMIVFRLGAGKDHYNALQTAKKSRGSNTAENALSRVKDFWKKLFQPSRWKHPTRQSIYYLMAG